MKHVGSYEAKTQLPRLLKLVEAGESVVITRNGRPVAQMIPAGREAKPDPAAAMNRLLGSRASLGGLSLQELRDEGRR